MKKTEILWLTQEVDTLWFSACGLPDLQQNQLNGTSKLALGLKFLPKHKICITPILQTYICITYNVFFLQITI